MISLRPWTGSIVARMTAWYAGSALVLILAATGFLYWVLATSFDAEDRRTLANTVTDLRLLLRASGELRLPEAATPVPSHSLRQPQEIWVRIVDAEGRTLLESPGMDGELPAAVFPPLAQVEAGQDVNGEVATASDRLFQVLSARALADPGHPDGRVLQVAMDRAAEELLLVHYRERLWLVLVVSVVLCSAMGYVIARRGMRPIERVTATARRVRSSTLHERIDTTDLPAELRALAATFNEMLDRLEESFDQISQFSADVAHELRTPVSNLRGELEVALGKHRPADEYRDILGSALEECVRISRVIQSLLFLARAETGGGRRPSRHDPGGPGDRGRPGVLRSCRGRGRGGTPHRGHDGLGRVVRQQAVGNLVANAIAHTPPGGRAGDDPSGQRRRAAAHRGGRHRPRHRARAPAARLRPVLPGRPRPLRLRRQPGPGIGHGQEHRHPARRVCRDRERGWARHAGHVGNPAHREHGAAQGSAPACMTESSCWCSANVR